MSHSHWTRKYCNHQRCRRNRHIQVSEESTRHNPYLQIPSQNESYQPDADIADEFLTVGQPDEVREARKVIENWLKMNKNAIAIEISHESKSTKKRTKSPTLRNTIRHPLCGLIALLIFIQIWLNILWFVVTSIESYFKDTAVEVRIGQP